MFRPIANGINPKTVVMAVKITGRKRAVPPSIMARIASFFSKSTPGAMLSSSLFLSISN